MIPPFFGKRPSLGLDIQSDGIRIVQAHRKAGLLSVVHFALIPMPAEVFVDGRVKSWLLFDQFLRDLVLAQGLKGAAVVTCLPAQMVRTQKLSFPSSMTGVDLEQAIKMELVRDLSGMADITQHDYSLRSTLDAAYQEVIVTATRQEYVEQLANAFTKAGLKLKILDVDVYALQRVFAATSSMLFVAGGVATFIVIDHDYIVFQQQWFIESATEFYGEFKTSLQLCRAMCGEKVVQRILLCGDYRMFALQAECLAALSGCQIDIQDDWIDVTLAPSLQGAILHADFAIALGLAMRQVPIWL